MDNYKLLKVKSQDLYGDNDIIASIRNEQINGILIKEFMPPQFVLSLAQSLIDNPSLMQSSYCSFGRIYAETIISTGKQFEQYFEHAQVFKTECEKFFGLDKNFETCLVQLLSKLVGSRSVSLPQGPNGASYSPATIRWVEPGEAIAPHCEKVYFQTMTSAFRLLNQIADADTIFSYFMLMQKSEVGGELFFLDFNSQNGTSTPIPISEGDLIIFNAGRIWHEVSKVKGTIPRITIGGFISFSKDDKTLYYFS